MQSYFWKPLFIALLFGICVMWPATVSAQQGDGGIGGNYSTNSITFLSNIEYIKHGNTSYKLDICQPKTISGRVPAIILTHGGGFRRGSKADLRDECVAIAQMGFVGVAVDYRLTDVAPYPAQIDDVQYAVRWVRANANKYDIDPARLGALGGSAGGYLAAMLGVRDSRDTTLGLAQYSSQVQVVVNRSGAPMNAADPSTLPDENGPFGQIRDEILKGYVGDRTLSNELLREISPVTYVSAKSSPLLAVYSTNDQFAKIGNAHAIVNALKSAGIEARLETFAGIGNAHGRSKLPNSEQEKLWTIEKQFLASHLSVISPSSPTPDTTPGDDQSPTPTTSIIPPGFDLPKTKPLFIAKALLIGLFIVIIFFLIRKK